MATKPMESAEKRANKGRHFGAFKFHGEIYELGDAVLLRPKHSFREKPYIAIIRDITENSGGLMLTGQWFYRPEEVERRGIKLEKWDNREVYYSFHLHEASVECIMHKCVIYFVPLEDELPDRSKQRGMFVRRVYDNLQNKIFELTDEHFKDDERREIDLLIQQTRELLKENSPIAAKSLHDDIPSRGYDEQSSKGYAEKDLMVPAKDDCKIFLAERRAFMGDKMRDKALESLLQGIWSIRTLKTMIDSYWLDNSLQAITGLEKLVYNSFQSDSIKYIQKIRQLAFNLKYNELLANRFLNKELEASVILNMTSEELKDGLLAHEKPKEPDQPKKLQMTEGCCIRCSKKNVGIADIMQGGSKERYLMECLSCGNTWYTSPGGAFV